MKIIYSSIFLLLTLYCYGQQPKNVEIPLFNSANLWSVLDHFTDDSRITPEGSYSSLKSSWHKIGNDSTINNANYKILLKSTDQTHENWSVSGCLRQDEKRIYFLDNDREILLYDFGLQVGDSMQSAIHSGFNYISRLDSVRDTTLNSSVRKIYYLTEFPAIDPDMKVKEIWIEGIGSISDGLLRQSMLGFTADAFHDYQLLCFHENETLIFQSGKYTSCYIDLVDAIPTHTMGPLSLQAYPNPASGKIMIEINSGEVSDCYLHILTMSGKTVRTVKISQTGRYPVDLSGIPSGAYILQLSTKKQTTSRKLLIL